MSNLTATKKDNFATLASGIIFTIGLVWVVASALGLLGGLSEDMLIWTGGLAFLTVILGGFLNKPEPYSAWLCFLGMIVFFAVGGFLRAQMGTLGHLSAERSMVPDMFTFAGYALAAVGLIILSRKKAKRVDIDGLIDAAVAAIAVMLVAWVYLVEPNLADGPTTLGVRLVIALYAPTSVFLLALTINYAYSNSLRLTTVSNKFLAGSLGLLFIGDILYMLVDTGTVTMSVQILDAPYALGFLLFPLAALHPSVKTPPVKEGIRETPSMVRLGIVSAGLVFPIIITLTQPQLTREDRVVIAILLVGLTGLAILKIFRAILGQKSAQSELRHRAEHDDLTGLPNRRRALKTLSSALKQAEESSRPLSVIFMDLDRFKYVNDSLGHSAGDRLIQAVADRLRAAVMMPHTVARLGGDEFIIIAKNANLKAATEIANDIRQSLIQPIRLGSTEVNTDATLGVATFDGFKKTTAAKLIESADTALYHGKESGRGRLTVFDDEMRKVIEESAVLEAGLRHALENDEIRVVFQPIVNSVTQKMIGAEALMRWEHPTLGNITPDRFIPVAEETGLILDVGRWMLHAACQQAAAWQKEHGRDFKVSVNVSARQITEVGFAEEVKDALKASGLPGHSLDLEITERLLVAASERISSLLEELKTLGVTLSVDDFGMGYSSLAYLKNFPLNRIKVDRSFTHGVVDPHGADIVLIKAIVSMAEGLNLDLVAEGVETIEQEKTLQSIGVIDMQGFHFGKPQCSEVFNTMFF